MAEMVVFKVKRQEGPQSEPRWEEFKVPYKEKMNVISLLREVQRNPVNAAGEKTTPVAFECGCLEEVCGACTMIINGVPRQACSTLVEQLEQPITLQPLTKFPVIRDLIVDRSKMFNNLKKVKAWIPIDGTYDLGPGPRQSQKSQEYIYILSRCMTCGCCMEACPNVNDKNNFIGPSTLAQVRLFNAHPTGAMNAEERLDAIIEDDGIANCGNSQNCVQVCPKQIPLTTAIAELNWATAKRGITRWLKK